MSSVFERYQSLCVDGRPICLERRDDFEPYFCYPVNARPIGFEGCILYCFLDGYGETVFAADPESCADRYVFPLAADFHDLMRLILACGSVSPVEQILWMDEARFQQHLQEEKAHQTREQAELLALLARELELLPMVSPFAYVKRIQAELDDSKIVFSDAYYDVLGIERGGAAYASEQMEQE